jgi:putative ABC transport system permease protein
MGAVAGITALALGSSSDFAQSRRDYEPQYATGATVVQAYGLDRASFTRLQDDTRRLLDGRQLLPYSSVDTSYDDQGRPLSTEPSQLLLTRPGCPVPEVGKPLEQTTGCDPSNGFHAVSTVASAAALHELGTTLSPTETTALDAGKVLVGDKRLLDAQGRVHLTLMAFDDNGKVTALRTLAPVPGALRAVHGKEYSTARGDAATMTPATAERLKLPLSLNGGVLSPGPTLSRADESRLAALVPTVDADHAVYTERGFQETYTVQLIALGLAGFLTVLVGTLTAVGLALSDSRPDLATLAAVGARPRTRRTMAAAQALVIGLLGAATGVLVGFVPGWAVSRPLTDNQGGPPVFDVPWLLLGGIGIGVPLLAALGALLMVRSRLPLTHRAA